MKLVLNMFPAIVVLSLDNDNSASDEIAILVRRLLLLLRNGMPRIVYYSRTPPDPRIRIVTGRIPLRSRLQYSVVKLFISERKKPCYKHGGLFAESD